MTGDNRKILCPRNVIGTRKQSYLLYVCQMVGTSGATSCGNSSATTQIEVVAGFLSESDRAWKGQIEAC